jgi:peroxiredoxin
VNIQAAQNREGSGDAGRDSASPLAGLIDRPLPALALPSTNGEDFDLRRLDRAVLYFYPGNTCSPDGGYDSPALDEAQHRAFAGCWHDFLALNCQIVGISSQAQGDQATVAKTLGIGQPLLSDSELRLAWELSLPRFGVGDTAWYRRLTLILDSGAIAHVFHPVTSATRSPAQAVAWMGQQQWR